MRKYVSNIAPHIERFLEQKRAFGFKYEENERYLANFDAMCTSSFPEATTITTEMGMAWRRMNAARGCRGA
jgi:hypothetical protein